MNNILVKYLSYLSVLLCFVSGCELTPAIKSELMLTPKQALPNGGEFLDELTLKDTGNGRDFEITNSFRYRDPKGILWVVPKSTTVNGASIPQPLWSIVGGPWEGKYRRASVIHDYFFDEKRYDSASVHRVFYDAMLTDGVSPFKAGLFYWAVVRFNDEWETSGSPVPSCGERFERKKIRCIKLPDDEPIPVFFGRVSVKFNESEYRNAEKQIKFESLTPEQIAKDALEKRKYAK